MATMHNPPHPGEILREWLGEMSVTDAAQHLGVARATLSRILNGTSGISADMALRLQAALGTSPEMWMGLQDDYELWLASKVKRPRIVPLVLAAQYNQGKSMGLNLIDPASAPEFLVGTKSPASLGDPTPNKLS